MIRRFNIDAYWTVNRGPKMSENKDGLYVFHTDHLACIAAPAARWR